MATTTISKLSVQVVDDLYTNYPTLFTGANKALYVNSIQSSINALIGKDIELSKTEPDYEAVMFQLIQSLSEDPIWYDTVISTTGRSIMRMIASGIAYDQFSIMRAFQEAFISTASSDNSVYAATRMLGVRPRRKLPSRVSVTFTRPDTGTYLEIPAYSSFSIESMNFFNREKLVFKSSSLTVSGYLYQGKVISDTINTSGEPFQKFQFGDGNRNASDVDVYLTVDSTEWTRVTEGPWQIDKNAKQYYESTAANGDIEIEFGNGDFGYIPDTSSAVVLRWVQTLGKSGILDASSLAVAWTDMPSGITVTGITTSICSGGDDEISASIYKKIASNLRGANNRAVRRSDYKAWALTYAGIKDALFRGQAELAPGRRSMMNVVGVTLLTDTTWSTQAFAKFESEFNEQLGIFQLQFLRIDPTPVVQNITASIYCTPDSILEDVKSELTIALTELYEAKINHLGYNIYLTDISDVLNGRRKASPSEKLERAVEYCVVDSSVTDLIMPSKTHYAVLGTVTLNMFYTTRGGYSGRLDLNPSTSV